MEVGFPVTNFNAHIQFGHNDMEIMEKNRTKNKAVKRSLKVKEPQVGESAF